MGLQYGIPVSAVAAFGFLSGSYTILRGLVGGLLDYLPAALLLRVDPRSGRLNVFLGRDETYAMNLIVGKVAPKS